jgi:hypothetical protein
MGLFGGESSGPRFSGLARQARHQQGSLNTGAFDSISAIQELVGGQIGQPFDISQMPRAVPSAGSDITQQVLSGQGGFGSTVNNAFLQSLTQSGANLLDPNMFNQFFNQSVAAPAQFDFDRFLQQASGQVASLGGERSGGFGSILGDAAREFGVNLAGQRASMQGAIQQQGAQMEADRLQRGFSGFGTAVQAGQQGFGNDLLRGQEDLSRWLQSQPFANPYVSQFLNLAVAPFDPALVVSGG